MSDEFFKFGIGLFRQHHFKRNELIALAAVQARHAFSFEAQHRAGVDHFGTVMVTIPDGVGAFTFPPSTASLSEIGRST